MFIAWYFKAFALTGRQVCAHNNPGRCPGLGASALSGRVGHTGRVELTGCVELTGRVGHTGRVELTCENSITEISHRLRLISEKKKKKIDFTLHSSPNRWECLYIKGVREVKSG